MNSFHTAADTNIIAKPIHSQRSNWLVVVLLTTSIAVFLSIATWHLREPGIYYDETLFVNAALGAKDSDSFVAARVFGAPLMLMPYIGALKAYIYAPIFYLFGVSTTTIRLPAIMIAAASLFVVYLVLSQFTSKIAAASFIPLLAVDPPFVLHVRTDLGPIVLMIALKVAALYCFLRAINTNSWRIFSVGLFCLSLGVFDKLNFVWIIIALIPAALIYIKPFIVLWRTNKIPMTIVVTTFIGILSLFIFNITLPLLHAMPSLKHASTNRFAELFRLFDGSLSGQFFSSWVFDDPVKVRSFCPVWMVPVAFVLAIASFQICRRQNQNLEHATKILRGVLFFSIFYAALFLEILFSAEAHGSHHFMVLWPIHYVILFLATTMLFFTLPTRLVKQAKILVSLILALWVTTNLSATINVITAFGTNQLKSVWSNHIYELADSLATIDPKTPIVIFADWGLQNQMLALCPSIRHKCQDLWSTFLAAGNDQEFRSRLSVILGVHIRFENGRQWQ